MNFTTNPEKPVTFSGFAGFYLGFLTSYNQTYIKTTAWNVSGFSGTDGISTVMEGLTYASTDIGSSSSSSHQYNLVEKPFNSTNFGLTLGAGIQQKLSDKLSLQFMLNYQLGFGDIKNVASQYRSGSSLQNVYDSNDPNRTVSHKNSIIGVMIGISKRF